MSTINEDDFKQLLSSASIYTDSLNEENKKNINYYLRNPRGDEKAGESSSVSSDCFDVVESDMPSITRTLLGGGDIMKFSAENPNDKREVIEAEQKTKLVNKIILHQENSFQTNYGWLKGAGIYNFSAVTYYPKETQKREIKVYQNITKIELDLVLDTLEANDKILSVEVASDIEDQGEFDAEIEIWRKSQEYCIELISPDKFIISKGGPTVDDLPFIGHYDNIRKGELIEMGVDKSVVEGLKGSAGGTYSSSTFGGSDNDQITDIQDRAIGDEGHEPLAPQWYLEEVEVVIACVMSGTKNGAIERRRVMYADNQIIKDEPFDHVNYAVLSAYPLPNSVIGLSRAGITRPTQDKKTFVERGMLNNIAQVNKPMNAINIDDNSGAVNPDDIRVRRTGGIVRVKGNPSQSIMPLVTPSIGAESLQLIQYLDFNRSQTTGSLMASQGLNKDDIYKETAARFNGVSKEGESKLENVLRIYAETGIKKLYRGVEWTLKHYQDSALEETILGEQITYSPNEWVYDCAIKSNVGLAASDTSELIQNLGVIYSSQKELKSMGSTLVDDSKIYGTLTRILKAMNVHDNASFYNDPAQPQQTIQAQNEQMKALISQMQQSQQNNSLVQASKEIEELKSQIAIMKDKNKTSIDAAKLSEQARQFDIEAAQKANKNRADNAIRITELELENNTQLTGGIDEQ